MKSLIDQFACTVSVASWCYAQNLPNVPLFCC